MSQDALSAAPRCGWLLLTCLLSVGCAVGSAPPSEQDSGGPEEPEDVGRVLDTGRFEPSDASGMPDEPIDVVSVWGCDQAGPTVAERRAYAGESWANLQHPPSMRAVAGAASEPVYGQLWVPGVTDQPGAAPGWQAEVWVGPLGTHPYIQGSCWRRFPTAFNVDVGNNDEHTGTLNVAAPGLYAYMMRYGQGPGQPGLLGDLDGPNDGARTERAGVLEVAPTVPAEQLVVVTLNLRCQADDWAARRPLVVDALARLSPDLVAFQEDCAAPDEAAQSVGLRAELAARTGRGYAWRRVVTHQAEHEGERYEEGISMLSAWPLSELVVGGMIDLPHVNFPRKAMAWTMRVGEAPVHVLATHFDYSAQAAGARDDSARALLEVLPAGERALVLGDLNATPDSAAYATLSGAMRDVWAVGRPGESGETVPAWAPTRRIDYIFAAGAFGAARGVELLDEHRGETWLSDHLGVAATLSMGR